MHDFGKKNLIQSQSFSGLLQNFLIKAYLASGIDVGQGINVGPGKFGKKNKRRALNTHALCSK